MRDALMTLLLLSNVVVSAQDIPPIPDFFGTWVWSSESEIDPQLPIYQCYIERLDDLGGGRVRMR